MDNRVGRIALAPLILFPSGARPFPQASVSAVQGSLEFYNLIS